MPARSDAALDPEGPALSAQELDAFQIKLVDNWCSCLVGVSGHDKPSPRNPEP